MGYNKIYMDLTSKMLNDNMTYDEFYNVILPELHKRYVILDCFMNFDELMGYPNVDYYIKKMIGVYHLDVNMKVNKYNLLQHAINNEWWELVCYLLRKGARLLDDNGDFIKGDDGKTIKDMDYMKGVYNYDKIVELGGLEGHMERVEGVLLTFYEGNSYMKTCIMVNMIEGGKN